MTRCRVYLDFFWEGANSHQEFQVLTDEVFNQRGINEVNTFSVSYWTMCLKSVLIIELKLQYSDFCFQVHLPHECRWKWIALTPLCERVPASKESYSVKIGQVWGINSEGMLLALSIEHHGSLYFRCRNVAAKSAESDHIPLWAVPNCIHQVERDELESVARLDE